MSVRVDEYARVPAPEGFGWLAANHSFGRPRLADHRVDCLGGIDVVGVSFVVSAYLQVVRHYDAIQTGVIFTAATVGLLASSLAAARLAKRYAQRTLILAGFIVTIAGVGVLLAMVIGISSPSAWVLAPVLLLIGLGLGAMLTPSVNLVQSSFGEERQGEISGLSRSVSNLGACLGTAIAGTTLVAGITSTPERSYGLAMIALAVVGLVGVVASVFLPAVLAPPAAARPPQQKTAPASRDDVNLPPASSNHATAQDAQLYEHGPATLGREHRSARACPGGRCRVSGEPTVYGFNAAPPRGAGGPAPAPGSTLGRPLGSSLSW